MSFEQGTEGGDWRTGTYFDLVAEQRGAQLQQRMDLYAGSLAINSSESFGPDTGRVDAAGQQLAYTLVRHETSDEDVAILTKSFRFGLRLSLELSDNAPGAFKALDSLERHPPLLMPMIIKTSTNRYLRPRRHLVEIVRNNIVLFAPQRQNLARAVISYALEEADHATWEQYATQEAARLAKEIDRFLDHPPGTES